MSDDPIVEVESTSLDVELDEEEQSGEAVELEENDAERKSDEAEGESKKEIYTYKAPWTIYGMGWSVKNSQDFRIAIGSFIEDYTNKVDVLALKDEKFEKLCSFDHPYPTTKIMWNPNPSGPDLIGTTGDYMRLWRVSEEQDSVRKEVVLNNNKHSDFCAPLTSFDWNTARPNVVGTASIDTTCSIWDIEAKTATHQLIAHDREVYDIAFEPESENVFASCSADGSLRQFDLRSLMTSTIVYETEDNSALLRLNWNMLDTKVLATFKQDTHEVIILDMRLPGVPVATLTSHTASVNAVSWAPHSAGHLCTAGDDAQALIWEIAEVNKSEIEDPILAYQADGEINQMMWNTAQPEWISISFDKTMQFLRV